MNVSDDSDGRAHMDHIALPHEELFCLCAYCLNHRFRQQFLLVEARDTLVEVHGSCEIAGQRWRP